jgi:hypothetical protein
MIARDNNLSSGAPSNIGNLVECSLAPRIISTFLEFLNQYQFKITLTDNITHNDVINDCLVTTAPIATVASGARVVRVGCEAGLTLTVLVVPYDTATCTMRAITTSAQCVFDIQLMSSSRTRLYVRDCRFTNDTTTSTTDLSTQFRRAQLRQFALLRRGCLPDASDQAVFMCYAMRMLLERDWHMDDAVVGRAGWVAARWGVMDTSPRCIRGNADQDLTIHKECPICFSEFSPCDIVVNLPCNHNVHVSCDMVNNNNSGMCMWLVTGKNPTCPCCRANIVR